MAYNIVCRVNIIPVGALAANAARAPAGVILTKDFTVSSRDKPHYG